MANSQINNENGQYSIGYSVKLDTWHDKDAATRHWSVVLLQDGTAVRTLERYESPDIHAGELSQLHGEIRDKVILGDFTIASNSIFVLLFHFGEILLIKHSLVDTPEDSRSEHLLSQTPLLSFANFGPVHFYSRITDLGDELFIYYSGGQQMLHGGESHFVAFDMSKDSFRQLTLDISDRLKADEYHKLFGASNSLDNRESVARVLQKVVLELRYRASGEVMRLLRSVSEKLPVSGARDFKYFGYIEDLESDTWSNSGDGTRYHGNTYFFYSTSDTPEVLRYDHTGDEWGLVEYR